MPLYLVEDDDRPMFVRAGTFSQAIAKWEQFVASESDEPEVLTPPSKGCRFIARDDELLLES